MHFKVRFLNSLLSTKCILEGFSQAAICQNPFSICPALIVPRKSIFSSIITCIDSATLWNVTHRASRRRIQVCRQLTTITLKRQDSIQHTSESFSPSHRGVTTRRSTATQQSRFHPRSLLYLTHTQNLHTSRKEKVFCRKMLCLDCL